MRRGCAPRAVSEIERKIVREHCEAVPTPRNQTLTIFKPHTHRRSLPESESDRLRSTWSVRRRACEAFPGPRRRPSGPSITAHSCGPSGPLTDSPSPRGGGGGAPVPCDRRAGGNRRVAGGQLLTTRNSQSSLLASRTRRFRVGADTRRESSTLGAAALPRAGSGSRGSGLAWRRGGAWVVRPRARRLRASPSSVV